MQRDAVAGILITAINIVAGFLIGVFPHGMDLKRARAAYAVLAIGDGLNDRDPGLDGVGSRGLMVTRAKSDNHMGMEIQERLFVNPQPLRLAGGADRDG